MTYKFEIVSDCILIVTNLDTGLIVLDKPKHLIYYNEKYLITEERIVLHDVQRPNRDIINEDVRLFQAVNANLTPFTVNSFQTFARDNLGFECGGSGSGGGTWGSITGDINTQTDLINLIDDSESPWDNVDGTPANQSSTDINYNGGNVGIGVPQGTTSDANLVIKGDGVGNILRVETSNGDTTLQADDNGSVWNSGVSGDDTNNFSGNNAGVNDTSTASAAFGGNSLQNNTGDESCGFGNNSLTNNTKAAANGFGRFSLFNNTGNNCNAFGYVSLRDNSGNNNSGFGHSTLRNVIGNNNSAFGFASGLEDAPNILLGSNNTFLGYDSSYGTNVNISNATAVGANIVLSQSNSVVLGNNADVGIGTTAPTAKLTVENTTSGQKLLELKTFLGVATLQADDNGSVWNKGLTSSSENTFFGDGAGQNIITNNIVTAVGYQASINDTGINSCSYGYLSLRNNTGDDCSGFGRDTLRSNTGNQACGFGRDALLGNSGLNCNGYGFFSLRANSGNFSNGFGTQALQNNTGDNCSAFGSGTLLNNSGDNNSAFGWSAGQENFDTLLGSNNTFLGANSTYGTNVNVNNATAVGANITLSQSNSVVLGDANVTDVFAGGNGAGLNLKSPNGTNYRISVDNTGTLVIV